MKKQRKRVKKVKVFKKIDEMHYKVYRYLDILGVSEPYLHATEILKEILPNHKQS